jgi:hypothetical protein
MKKIVDEGFINRGGRHEVIAGELTQQGSTFQVNTTEWVLSVLVAPPADELESVHRWPNDQALEAYLGYWAESVLEMASNMAETLWLLMGTR